MWSENLKLNYPMMSRLQKKAADYLLENAAQVKEMTIRRCAAGAGVGQPTVVRMLEECGYESWAKFQQSVWMETGRCSAEQEADSAVCKSVVLQAIRDDMQVLAEMAKNIDTAQMAQVVKIIKKAKIIDVYGTDNSANAATELAGRFLHLGLASRNYSDLFFQKISAGHLGKKDVAIGFSMAGETTAIIDALNSARECGAVTIAVTGAPESTVAKGADYVFVTPTIHHHEESRWISSRIAQIAFVDAICAAMIESDQKKFAVQLNKSTREFQEDVTSF